MYGQLRFSDYRCFRREAPATLELAPGFTSFIGANNAGKTTLLRALWELRLPLSQVLAALRNSGSPINLCGPDRRVAFTGNSLPEFDDIVAERPNAEMRVDVVVERVSPTLGKYLRRVVLALPPGTGFEVEMYTDQAEPIWGSGTATVSNFLSHDGKVIQVGGVGAVDISQMIDFLITITRSMYVGSFRNPVNAGGGHPYFDIQVGSNFINSWHIWQNGSKTQRTALYKLVRRVERMMGLSNLSITSSVEGGTLLTEIGGRHGKLSDLGSGIAHVLLTLANALIQEPRLIAIDEPETGLHPALQRSFLEALGEVAPYGVLFTTHSMGLARTETDRCFTVHRIGNDSKVRLYEKTGHLGEVLGSMGIAALQDLAYTRLLLVEGQTEVRVFKRFLALYGLEADTVKLSLGGSTLINGKVAEELSEVLRICPDIRAIVDSERHVKDATLAKDRIGFKTVCSQLGIPCCITEFRATDNYFSQAAIDAVFGEGKFVQLGPYDLLTQQWGKTENWRVAAYTSRDELDQTDIGKFLADWAPAHSSEMLPGSSS